MLQISNNTLEQRWPGLAWLHLLKGLFINLVTANKIIN